MCNPPLLSSSFESLSSPSSSSLSTSYFTTRNIAKGRRAYTPMYKNDYHDYGHDQYFLDSCFLCKTHLYSNDDVYMYKGDMAFCSEECRQDQIEIDEAKAKKNKLTILKKSKIDKITSKSQEIHVTAAGTVIA